MGVPPRPGLARDRQFLFDGLVVGLQVLVGDRPIGPDVVERGGVEVGGVEAGGVAGVVDHRSAHSPSGVVGSERDRVRSADDARVGPVEVVRPVFVAHPVTVGIPERPGIEADDLGAGPGQPLDQGGASCAAADHDDVHLVVRVVVPHVGAQLVVGPFVSVGQQPCRRVAVAYLGVAEAAHVEPGSDPVRRSWACLAASTRSAHGTGSWASTSERSHGSRRSTPRFLYPLG